MSQQQLATINQTGIATRQILPVATPAATRAAVKIVALTLPPKIADGLETKEWLDLATRVVGQHPQAVLERAIDVMIATHKWQITVADIVEAVLMAYRELGVVLSPDARVHAARRASKAKVTAL